MNKKLILYSVIGILILAVLGGLFIYQTHKSVDQELTDNDLEIQKALQEQSSKQSETIEQTTSETQNDVEQTEVVEEPVEEESSVVQLKTGEFNPDAKDSDAFHRGWGEVSLVSFDGKNKVVTGEDFKVTNGPDYELYLFKEQGIETKEQFNELRSGAVSIAEVKQFTGFQTFEVPDNVNPEDINSVVIWCERFSVFITTADLN